MACDTELLFPLQYQMEQNNASWKSPVGGVTSPQVIRVKEKKKEKYFFGSGTRLIGEHCRKDDISQVNRYWRTCNMVRRPISK